MPWHLVVIEKFDVTAADMEASSLISKFCKESEATLAHSAVEVWHRKDADATHRYYFSPAAVASAPEILTRFRSVACEERPDLSGFTKLSM
jgi:hypothetical protein